MGEERIVNRKTKIRIKFVPLGINIIDHDGTWLAGITEQDALDLLKELNRVLPKIKRRAKQMA